MRWTLRTQILIPFAILLLGVIALTAGVAATVAVQRLRTERILHSRDVAGVLSMSQFPTTAEVLGKLKILTGCEVVVAENGQVVASTFPQRDFKPSELQDGAFLTRGDDSFQVIAAARRVPSSQQIYILAPGSIRWVPWREVIWPIVGVAILTGVLATVLAAFLASRYARQIRVVQTQLQELAERRYRHSNVEGSVVELAHLQQSANELAVRLEGLESQIAETERLRLLGQLSGGLAHTLRNALAGARLAIQYHQKRCPFAVEQSRSSSGGGLDAAKVQLQLVEDQVQGLLSLGSPQLPEPLPGDLREILPEVERLITPVCAHHRVRCEAHSLEMEHALPVADAQGMRISILNLCLNAIEAAGPNGEISVAAESDGESVRIIVSDNGPGMDEGIAERIGEAFVSGKPEGIGLGLLIAREVIQRLRGNLSWNREGDRTMIVLSWPLPANLAASRSASSELGVFS